MVAFRHVSEKSNIRRLLDVGCGIGVFLEHAKFRKWSVFGIETNKKARKIAEKRLKSTIFENIDDLNTILIDLNVALKQQAELVALNKESSDKMTKMMELIEQTSSTLAAEMQASTAAMAESNKALSESLSTEVISKAMGQNNQLAVKLASMEAALSKSIKNVEGKLVKNTDIGALSAAQKNTSAQVEMLAGQNVKILRLLEVQQDRISFP